MKKILFIILLFTIKIYAADSTKVYGGRVYAIPTGTQTVTGTINVGNTPNVRVGNFPSVQPVNGTVNIGNSPVVTVSNFPSALSATLIDDSVKVYFSNGITVNMNADSFFIKNPQFQITSMPSVTIDSMPNVRVIFPDSLKTCGSIQSKQSGIWSVGITNDSIKTFTRITNFPATQNVDILNDSLKTYTHITNSLSGSFRVTNDSLKTYTRVTGGSLNVSNDSLKTYTRIVNPVRDVNATLQNDSIKTYTRVLNPVTSVTLLNDTITVKGSVTASVGAVSVDSVSIKNFPLVQNVNMQNDSVKTYTRVVNPVRTVSVSNDSLKTYTRVTSGSISLSNDSLKTYTRITNPVRDVTATIQNDSIKTYTRIVNPVTSVTLLNDTLTVKGSVTANVGSVSVDSVSIKNLPLVQNVNVQNDSLKLYTNHDNPLSVVVKNGLSDTSNAAIQRSINSKLSDSLITKTKVMNFPANQTVSGTVEIGNFPGGFNSVVTNDSLITNARIRGGSLSISNDSLKTFTRIVNPVTSVTVLNDTINVKGFLGSVTLDSVAIKNFPISQEVFVGNDSLKIYTNDSNPIKVAGSDTTNAAIQRAVNSALITITAKLDSLVNDRDVSRNLKNYPTGLTTTSWVEYSFGFTSKRITIINRGSTDDIVYWYVDNSSNYNDLVGNNESVTLRQARSSVFIKGSSDGISFRIIAE